MNTTQILDAVGDPFAPGGGVFAFFNALGPFGSLCLIIGGFGLLLAGLSLFRKDPMRFFWP